MVWYSYGIIVDVTDSASISAPGRGSLVRRVVARLRLCLRRQSLDVASGERQRDAPTVKFAKRLQANPARKFKKNSY